MNKKTVIASSIFDIIFSIALLAGAAVLFVLFYQGWLAHLDMVEETAILFILLFVFYILSAAVVMLTFIGGIACLILAVFYFVAGIKKLKLMGNDKCNRVGGYAVFGFVFAGFACLSTVIIAVRTIARAEFDLISVVCLVIFAISAVNVTLNALTYAGSKVAAKNNNK